MMIAEVAWTVSDEATTSSVVSFSSIAMLLGQLQERKHANNKKKKKEAYYLN